MAFFEKKVEYIMPLPSPRGREDKDSFISKCMGDHAMNEEFPDRKQRAAVCYSKWKKAKGGFEIDFTEQIKDRKYRL